MIKPESQIITITQITPEIFNQLRSKYASTLSCPCTTITMPYKTFLNSAITLHPVCSSLFVSRDARSPELARSLLVLRFFF